MLDLHEGVLTEFASKTNVARHWASEGLTLHRPNPHVDLEQQKFYRKRNKDKRNAHRNAMRKLNPGYGR